MARTLRLALRCIGLGLLAGLCTAAVAGSPAGEAAASLYVQARALEHGEGVARDPAQAIALYCAAVRQGNAEAMHALGWMYANGRAVERNDSLASTLFAMAAFSGHTHANTMLAHVGPHRGEVPDCLLASAQAGRRAPATATAPEWNLAAYIAAQPPSRRAMVELVARLAPQYAIEPRLALAVAATALSLMLVIAWLPDASPEGVELAAE